MKPTLIDTVFVVALVNEDDELHPDAFALAQRHNGRPLLVTNAVLFEVGNALARSNRSDAAAAISSLLTSPEVEVVTVSPDLFARALDLYRTRTDKAWGLVDCVSFVVMRERGIDGALTFDQHFVQAGFQALMRAAPQ